jgi:hypothetical protein
MKLSGVLPMLAPVLLLRVCKENNFRRKEKAMKTIKSRKKVQEKKTGVQLCIWSEVGMVSSRSCTRRLDCQRCQFDQNMTDFFVDDLSLIPPVPAAA